ncbi:MAG: aspartate aminotransferase family protein, partial [Actinomycetes bacterium]|nr:aspartate aminotransferase family protein [Actinomycetes bacterium]MDX5450191.1 aspartate aminotransferase family protein [Actinomycetes bacterium]
MPIQLDRSRIARLIEEQTALLNERTVKSKAMYAHASEHLSGGVASSYQGRDPWPIYIDSGSGDRIVDVDGNEY